MLRLLLPVLCTLAVWSSISSAEEKNGAYLLNPGDTIHISVWGEEKLNQDAEVLPDGSITFPLAGQIEVAGLDSTAVAKKIAAKIAEFVPDPNVNVVVTKTTGNIVYVQGKVLKPGSVQMVGPTRVLQVLSMSGGFDKFADLDEIKVLRMKGDKQEVIPVDYSKLMTGKDMTTNIQLKAGDTLVVP